MAKNLKKVSRKRNYTAVFNSDSDSYDANKNIDSIIDQVLEEISKTPTPSTVQLLLESHYVIGEETFFHIGLNPLKDFEVYIKLRQKNVGILISHWEWKNVEKMLVKGDEEFLEFSFERPCDAPFIEHYKNYTVQGLSPSSPPSSLGTKLLLSDSEGQIILDMWMVGEIIKLRDIIQCKKDLLLSQMFKSVYNSIIENCKIFLKNISFNTDDVDDNYICDFIMYSSKLLSNKCDCLFIQECKIYYKEKLIKDLKMYTC